MTAKKRWSLTLLAAILSLTLFATSASADEGWASWYGPGFQGNHMANGQIYDMYDPTTTANNEYPFGTWLKVTNPANGRSVVVQVRDRGGFGHGVDLSYAAFAVIADPARMGIRVVYEVVSGPGGAEDGHEDQTEHATAAENYVVRSGDTLIGIANRYGLDMDSLARFNGIKNLGRLSIGQTLRIPVAGGERAGAVHGDSAASVEGEYVVQPGDALFNIALRLGVSMDAIAALNAIADPALIAPGTRLKLPSSSPLRSQPAAKAETYEVKPGDTLYDIAIRFDTTIDALISLNGIVNPKLVSPGQTLRLP